MSNWIGFSGLGSEESSLDPTHGRVTNPERFRPLHPTMLEIIARLENDFDIERTERYGLDCELSKAQEPACPDVKLTPRDPAAAHIVAAFSTFPGLIVRFGRWYSEPFPSCGCDACDESPEIEIDRLKEVINDKTAGRFRETIESPRISFMGRGLLETRFCSADYGRNSRSRRRTRVDGRRALGMDGEHSRMDLNWKPWDRDPASNN